MANVAIPNLPTVTAVTGTEQIPAIQNGVTVRLTASQIASLAPQFTPVTVASLPGAGAVGIGGKAFVSDATATTFASIVVGGGTNNVPVYSDGTNWRIG